MEELLGRYGGGAKPGAAARFLKPALYALDTEALLAWFRERGLEFVTEPSGKIFPASGKALDVLGALRRELELRGVELRTGSRVASAEAAAGAFSLKPEEGDDVYRAPNLLLATGGLTWPRTGSEGDGYRLARSLGHGLVRPRPALAALRAKDWALGGLSGLSFRGAAFALRRGGRLVGEREGDLLITHEGVSGPLILDGSRDLEAGDLLELRFLPLEGTGRAAAEALESRLDAEIAALPRGLLRNSLASLGLPRSLAERLLELAGLAPGQVAAQTPRPARRELCRLAAAFPVEIAALGGADSAMVTAGGVPLSEVDPKTMESRIAPGLFFAGELLDIDGDTGGYNLHAAFATANLAARALASRLLAGG